MDLKFIKPVVEEVAESDVQQAFEENLVAIEEGLQYISSYVPVGTGVIDTLAIDDENNVVIIEFKRMGDFDRDALLQLMNYYSWFVTDPNHKLYLDTVVRKKLPEFDGVNTVRLIAIVSDVSDIVRNACWALEPSIKLVTYSLMRDTNGSIGIIPHIVLDTSHGIEKEVKPPKKEEDHLKDRDDLKPIYHALKKRILSEIDSKIEFNPAPQDYIGVVGKKMFAGIFFKRKWVRLDLLLKPKDIGNNPRLIDFGAGDWSYTHIESVDKIDSDVMVWLKLAYQKAA